MVVVDRLSKYAHFSALPATFTAETVADTFIKDIVRLHGIPSGIVSDRGSVFLSAFWREFFHRQGTTLSYSTAYHPQSDGQTEVINRILEDYLRCYVTESHKDWLQYLPWAELHYNTALHSGLGMSPFEAVYGRSPPVLLDFIETDATTTPASAILMDRTTIINKLKHNLERAKNRMTMYANRHRTDVEFTVGDWVFVKLVPYRQ